MKEIFKGNGCHHCPAHPCIAYVYRGSTCAAIRAKAGVDFDPDRSTGRDGMVLLTTIPAQTGEKQVREIRIADAAKAIAVICGTGYSEPLDKMMRGQECTAWDYADALYAALLNADWNVDHKDADDSNDYPDEYIRSIKAVEALITGYGEHGIKPIVNRDENVFEVLFFDANCRCTKSLWRKL